MIKRSSIILLILFAVNQFSAGFAFATATLRIISRADESARMQIFLHFDKVPAYTIRNQGKKLELELSNTQFANPLTLPFTDGRMIKVITQPERPDSHLSFYFRYPLQQVQTKEDQKNGTLMLDLLIGNHLSANYPALSTRLQGVAVLRAQQADLSNPLVHSRYAANWPTFFSEYETPVSIQAPAHLLLPTFPLAAAILPALETDSWLPLEAQALAEEGQWSQVAQVLLKEINYQPDEARKERLLLTYAEALVREGHYQEPYKLLQQISIEYPDTLLATLAQLLFIHLEARHGDIFSAYFEMLDLEEPLAQTTELDPYLKAMLAELALISGKLEQARLFLDHPVLAQTPELQEFRLMRTSDILYTQHKPSEALLGYLELAARSSLINQDPRSLAQFADLLYKSRLFQEAGKRYTQLGALLNDTSLQDMAYFRRALCDLASPETAKRVPAALAQIQSAFPVSEAAVRAQLKQTDLGYLAGTLSPSGAQAAYGQVARESTQRALREEGSFKQALVNALAGKRLQSVEQCMALIRGFQSGTLRSEATALIIQQLPGLIEQLVADKEYIKALVLSKQNRKLFVHGWMPDQSIRTVADAYAQLGMADQAVLIYRYLFEIADDEQKEQIYLPLIRSLADAGLTARAEEYTDRYLLRYPQGRDQDVIFLLKIHLLYVNGQLDKALRLLQAKLPSLPQSPELNLLSGKIFFALKDWQQTINALSGPHLAPLLERHNLLTLLAEAYFQLGQYAQAGPLFQRLEEQEPDNDQARFRLAQIASRQGNRQRAMQLFDALATKAIDPIWAKLAREEAEVLRLQAQ